MTVFVSLGTGVIAGNHVLPTDYEVDWVSQCLVDASHNNDLKLACEFIVNPLVDVNFVGTVSLKMKVVEIVLHDALAYRVRVECKEFKTEVTALTTTYIHFNRGFQIVA